MASWYVFAGHAEHVRFLVLESALVNCPLLHVVCAAHDVLVVLFEAWYVFAGHARHDLLTRW